MSKSNWPTTSRHERGYGTAWNKLRQAILRRDCGMCQCDECKGKRLRGSEVHHIIAKVKGGTDDPANLQCVNSECHKRITAAEQGKTIQPKVAIGLDGYPVARMVH